MYEPMPNTRDDYLVHRQTNNQLDNHFNRVVCAFPSWRSLPISLPGSQMPDIFMYRFPERVNTEETASRSGKSQELARHLGMWDGPPTAVNINSFRGVVHTVEKEGLYHRQKG
jgi:hypothetical protein